MENAPLRTRQRTSRKTFAEEIPAEVVINPFQMDQKNTPPVPKELISSGLVTHTLSLWRETFVEGFSPKLPG